MLSSRRAWIGREVEIEAARHEIDRGIEAAKVRDDGCA